MTSQPSLDDFLSGVEPDFDAEPVAPADEVTVQRWLYRLARLNDEADKVRIRAKLERETVDLWERDTLAPLLKQQTWLEAALAAFHRAVHARERSEGRQRLTATIKFPTGRLKSKAVHGGVEWVWENDGAETLAWAVANGRTDLYHDKPVLLKVDTKNTLKPLPGSEGQLVEVVDPNTGEKVPGVHCEVVERTYRIELER
jgi:hypothetical protein